MSLRGYKPKYKKALWMNSFNIVQSTALPPNTGMIIVTDPNTGQPDFKKSVMVKTDQCATKGFKAVDRKLSALHRGAQAKATAARRRRANAMYNAARKEFLSRQENRWCQVALKRDNRLVRATHVHHLRGRHRTLLVDTRFFAATSFNENNWPHEHPDDARGLGLLCDRGDWRREPGDAETKRIAALMEENGAL